MKSPVEEQKEQKRGQAFLAPRRAAAVCLQPYCKKPLPSGSRHECCSVSCARILAGIRNHSDVEWQAAVGIKRMSDSLSTPSSSLGSISSTPPSAAPSSASLTPSSVKKAVQPTFWMGAREVIKPSLRMQWRQKAVDDWSMNDLWFWFCYELPAKADAVANYNLTSKGFGQLATLNRAVHRGNGQRGVEVEELKNTLQVIIDHYHVFARHFKWGREVTPGLLLCSWNRIESALAGMDGVLRGELRGEPGAVFVCKGLQEESDYSVEAAYKQRTVEPPREGKTKRILITEWQRLPVERWSVTTVWAMISDSLAALEVAVVPTLSPYQRQKIKALVERQGMEVVRPIAQMVAENYLAVERHFNWYRPFTVGAFVGYFPGLLRLRDMSYQRYVTCVSAAEDYHVFPT